MSKAEAMDKLIEAYSEPWSSSAIIDIVREAFSLDLNALSDLVRPPRDVFEDFLSQRQDAPITGTDIRRRLNEAVGINLDGLSALDGARFSLFSKGQWMVRGERDLFVIHTGPGDIDATILTTDHYVQLTGTTELPPQLKDDLTALGYRYDETKQVYTYSDPGGNAVPDAFKGQTIRAIRQAIGQLAP